MPSIAPKPRPAPRTTVQLLARVDPSLKVRVTRLAFERGVFEARLVEEALTLFCDTQEKKAARR